jgi:hypothetical protein
LFCWEVKRLSTEGGEGAIRAASAAWSQAASAKDLDKAVAFYAAALILPEKAPASRGKENFRKLEEAKRWFLESRCGYGQSGSIKQKRKKTFRF